MEATYLRAAAARTTSELNLEKVIIQLDKVARCEKYMKKRKKCYKVDTPEEKKLEAKVIKLWYTARKRLPRTGLK